MRQARRESFREQPGDVSAGRQYASRRDAEGPVQASLIKIRMMNVTNPTRGRRTPAPAGDAVGHKIVGVDDRWLPAAKMETEASKRDEAADDTILRGVHVEVPRRHAAALKLR